MDLLFFSCDLWLGKNISLLDLVFFNTLLFGKTKKKLGFTKMLVIFHLENLKDFYLTQTEDHRTAQEIQKKREEERDSELEKNKIMVTHSFQPIFERGTAAGIIQM